MAGSNITLDLNYLTRSYKNVSYILPTHMNFTSIEDGVNEIKVLPYGNGKVPIVNNFDLIYLSSNFNLKLTCIRDTVNSYTLNVLPSKPILIGTSLLGMEYENMSHTAGVLKIAHYTFNLLDKSDSFIITWGNTSVNMGNNNYLMGSTGS